MDAFSTFFKIITRKVVIRKKRIVKRRKKTITSVKEYTAKKRAARLLVLDLLEKVNKIYNFEYGQVAIRNQKTRWGSCSSQGNLNFNYKIVDLPPRLAEYIVVHELCHLKEMNHAASFWNLVAVAMPDYKEARKELKNSGIRLG